MTPPTPQAVSEMPPACSAALERMGLRTGLLDIQGLLAPSVWPCRRLASHRPIISGPKGRRR